MSNPFRTTSRNYWQQNPLFFYLSFISCGYTASSARCTRHARSHDSASLGAVATCWTGRSKSQRLPGECVFRLSPHYLVRKDHTLLWIKTPSLETHHTTPHHITPHHIAAPQREFGCRIPPRNMYASWQSTNTNTNTIPNDGNDILAKVQTQVPPTSNSSSRSVWSLSVPTSSVPGHIN
jgi:hypothetical protein